MAYYYNGNPILAPLQITSNRMAFQVETLSLKQTTFLTEAQRWELSFGIMQNSGETDSFLAHTADYYRKKTMVMPQLNDAASRLTFVGTLETSILHIGGDDTVSVTASGSGRIPKGYFIKFQNHDKIYTVTEDVTFASNTQTVNIFPNLTNDMPIGTDVLLRDQATIRYQLDLTSMQGIAFNDGVISSVGSIRIIEAL